MVAKLGALREAVASLQITVIEDRPLSGAVLLVERLGNATDDLRGLVEQALAAALEATTAVGNPPDSYRARNALANANRQFVCLDTSSCWSSCRPIISTSCENSAATTAANGTAGLAA